MKELIDSAIMAENDLKCPDSIRIFRLKTLCVTRFHKKSSMRSRRRFFYRAKVQGRAQERIASS